MSAARGVPAMRGQILRFLAVGGIKTATTTLLFYLLAAVLPPRLAFTLVYVAGLTLVALATPRYVFGVRAGLRRLTLLLGWYAAIYFVGLVVVSWLESVSDSRALLALGTIAVTAPLGFAGARFLLRRPSVEASVPAGPA